jgi:hypothetical protein
MKSILITCSKKQLCQLNTKYDIPYQKKDRKYKLMKNIVAYWQSVEETCPICLDTIDYNTCVITQCNHLYCDTCIVYYLKNANTCPICKTYCDYIEIISTIDPKRICMMSSMVINEPIEEGQFIDPHDLHIATNMVFIITFIEIITVYLILKHMYSMVYLYTLQRLLG